MQAWKEEQLQALLRETSDKTLFDTVVSFARKLGFDSCAYGVRAPLPISAPKILMLNNYSAQWQKTYQNMGYLAVDPAVKHGMTSLKPYRWPVPEAPQDAMSFWEDAQANGLSIGWAQPVLAPNGVRGMLTLSRDGESLTAAEIQDHAPNMLWLSQVAHIGLSRHLIPRAHETGILTARECEVLRWTADGKTSSEISMIINVSERTVNFHINSAMAKLGAPNRTAAVVRAVVLGLIT